MKFIISFIFCIITLVVNGDTKIKLHIEGGAVSELSLLYFKAGTYHPIVAQVRQVGKVREYHISNKLEVGYYTLRSKLGECTPFFLSNLPETDIYLEGMDLDSISGSINGAFLKWTDTLMLDSINQVTTNYTPKIARFVCQARILSELGKGNLDSYLSSEGMDRELLSNPFFLPFLRYAIRFQIETKKVNPNTLVQLLVKRLSSTPVELVFVSQACLLELRMLDYTDKDQLLTYFIEETLLSKSAKLPEVLVKKLEGEISRIRNTKLGTTPSSFSLGNYQGGLETIPSVGLGYSILVFWDTDCISCQANLPMYLDELVYPADDMGVKVRVINMGVDKARWTKQIQQWESVPKLHLSCLNLEQKRGLTNTFNINQTPDIYILNNNGEIEKAHLSLNDAVAWLIQYAMS